MITFCFIKRTFFDHILSHKTDVFYDHILHNKKGVYFTFLRFIVKKSTFFYSQAIEAALISLPNVSNSVVLVHGEEGEDKFLVAYIVLEGQATKKKIRSSLKRRLPFYMIPSYFVFLPR